MAETKPKASEKIEREYTISLREKLRPVPRYKKTPKAVKTIKEFLARHMKVRDRDLKKIKIDSYLNEELWMRGIRNPVHKVKVKVVKDGDVVRVYSASLPEKINFKKLREEKLEIKAKADVEKQKTLMEKAKDTMKGKKEEPAQEKSEEEKKEEAEKEKASKIAQEQIEKEMAKSQKHIAKAKTGKQKVAEKKGQNMTSRGY